MPVALLAKKGIQLFGHIDHASEANKVGLCLRPMQVLIFGIPQVGTPPMESQQTIGLDLLLRALVWEDEAGKVWLTYHPPDFLAHHRHVAGRDAVKVLDVGLAALVRLATSS